MNKVIISGGRDFTDYTLMNLKCTKILKALSKEEIQIVNGGAKGADELALRFATAKNIVVKHFAADWDKNGKAAGPIRNKEMAAYATHLIAFWNGLSRGTEDMIRKANVAGLKVRIIKYAILLLFAMPCKAQWYKVTKNDAAIMSVQVLGGYAQGWREEVIYHPNQLFRRFPNLNRKFWDIRVQDAPGFLNTEWDADHVLKGFVAVSNGACVVIKIGGPKQNWKKYVFDAIKYYGSYKAGFFLSYNVTHKNKL